MNHAITLALIGAGNMAEAIARALARWPAPPKMVACDPSAARRELFERELGITCHPDASAIEPGADVVLLAVKPQAMAEVLEVTARRFTKALFVSIAAGITTAFIERYATGRPVVRAMPNTPLMVGLGATAIAPGAHAGPAEIALARDIFQSSGVVVQVREDQIDAVTAVSGSGPAYVFFLVEQMIRAGQSMGLPPGVAECLARQTALGAARMLADSPDTPAELRRKVTSPGGTTEAAIEHMRRTYVDQHIVEALRAAQDRGKELGR